LRWNKKNSKKEKQRDGMNTFSAMREINTEKTSMDIVD
jgi:hypothetical protein